MENTDIVKTKKSKSQIATEWGIMLAVVLLFSSAVNCLFQMLAYGKAFDIVLFVVSLGLALFSYFNALNPKKNPVLQKRVVIAAGCVVVWAILIPIISMVTNSGL